MFLFFFSFFFFFDYWSCFLCGKYILELDNWEFQMNLYIYIYKKKVEFQVDFEPINSEHQYVF
jgi:hypothetical protein